MCLVSALETDIMINRFQALGFTAFVRHPKVGVTACRLTLVRIPVKSPVDPRLNPLKVLGPVFGALRPVLKALEPVLKALGPVLKALEPVLKALGPVLKALGPVLEALEPVLKALEPVLTATSAPPPTRG